MKHLVPVALLGLLLALAAGCTKSPTEPDGPVYPDPAGSMTAADLKFCVDETNRYRAQQNRPALNFSEDLSERARLAAEHDHAVGKAHDYFRMNPLGGAENEVLWWSGSNVRQTFSAAIAGFYSEGPSGGHFQNLIGPYTEVGCGVTTGGGGITFVQDLR